MLYYAILLIYGITFILTARKKSTSWASVAKELNAPESLIAKHTKITKDIPIPTIGIGASPDCDGQILVMEDMLGLNPKPPRFVREYAHLGPEIEAAVTAYAADVKSRRFPGRENVYSMKTG